VWFVTSALESRGKSLRVSNKAWTKEKGVIGRLFGILSIIGGGYFLLLLVSTAVALARKLWEKRHDKKKD